ncbi:MAG: LegC family aminotransferase, partial [Clostridia bacterium]|nr:LegC family aminotransferase [Clostridia bacterium]
YVTAFEKSIADYVGTPAAVSCQSGTAGLHTALLLCDVTAQDMVIVPTLTFIAAVNPVKYVGATPVFMDCDDSLCMDPIKLRRFCKDECDFVNGTLIHKKSARRIPALVVVHVFGNMADMEQIMEIAQSYNLKVIEDATEALGTRYCEGKYAGRYAGTIGTFGVFSFNGNKIITTGGGGMIVSGDTALLDRAKHLTTQAKSDEENFFHDEIGYNYRMTNIQAALGLAQLEQLEGFITTKCSNYLQYKQALSSVNGLSILEFRSGIRPNYWFYSLYVDRPFSRSRSELISYLKTKKIQTRPVWGLIHMQLPYEGSFTYQIEKAYEFWEHIVNLPCSSSLSSEDVERIVNAIIE